MATPDNGLEQISKADMKKMSKLKENPEKMQKEYEKAQKEYEKARAYFRWIKAEHDKLMHIPEEVLPSQVHLIHSLSYKWPI